MTLYEFKMHLKKLGVIKALLKYKKSKRINVQNDALSSIGIDLVIDVEKALKKTGVVFYADYGTLLGIIRDHAFINWDDDLDYGLMIDDFFNWTEFENQLNECGFRKVRQFEYGGYIKEQTYAKDVLTVDFFGHQNAGDKNIGHIFFRKEDYIYSSKDEFHVTEAEYAKFVGIKTVDFLGTMVHVPRNAEEYLESIYTKNWKVPDPNWSHFDDSNRKIKVLENLGKGYFYE